MLRGLTSVAFEHWELEICTRLDNLFSHQIRAN